MSTVDVGETLAVSPVDVWKFYDFTPMFKAGVNAAGETIAIMGFPGDGINTSDVTKFWSMFKVNGSTIKQVVAGGGSVSFNPTVPSGSSEMTSDAEWAGVTGMGANITVVTTSCPNGCNGTTSVAQWESELDYITNYTRPNIVSSSVGPYVRELAPDTMARIHDQVVTAAAEDTLVVAATGDNSYNNTYYYSKEEGMDALAADPFAIGVGGVQGTLSNSNLTGFKVETAWVIPYSWGSAGGPTPYYAKPLYQSSDAITAFDSFDTHYSRVSPDISMPAGPSVAFYFHNKMVNLSGTSFAAPMFAGLMADEFRYTSPDPLVANALYSLGYSSSPYGYVAYHDIIYTEPRSSPFYCSEDWMGYTPLVCPIEKWDPVTGIGSPIAWNMVRALRNYYTGNLSYYLKMSASPSAGGTISPQSGWHSSGGPGSVKVTVSAVANSGYTFTGWTGTGTGSYSGPNSTVTITLGSNVTESASFQQVYTLTLVTTPTNGGTITRSPPGTGSGGSYSYPSGTLVSLTENPAAGYDFQYWVMYKNGVYLGTNTQSTINVIMNGNYLENAYFVKGGGGGPGCVLSGTMIALANGTQVPVQSLRSGTPILSFNVNSRSLVPTTVSSNSAIQVNQVLNINKGQLYISGLQDQPIYARMQNGTMRNVLLGRLAVGMQLYEPTRSSWVAVTALAIVSGTFTVYDLRTANGGNYIANMFIPSPK